MNSTAVLRGIRWNLATGVLRRIISGTLVFFLADWLSQADFGVFRTFSLILVVGTTLAVFGMNNHYLTDKRRRHLDLFAFTQISSALALLISIAISLASGFLGRVYHSPELGLILRWAAFFVIVEVTRANVRAKAQLLYRFRELAIAETINVLFYTVLCLSVIYFVREVWLYVLFFFLGNLIEVIYLLCVLPVSRSIRFKRLFSLKWWRVSLRNLKQSLSFQINVSVIELVNTYSGNAPILFLGTMVAPQYMGLYFFATQLVGVPVSMFTSSVGQVLYPVFAQNDNRSRVDGISAYARLALKVGLPLLIFFSFLLNLFIPIVLGDKWNQALPLLYILIGYFGTSILNDPISSIPYICRKPHYELIWNISTLALRLLALSLGIMISFEVAILAFCLVSGLMNCVFYLMSLRMLQAPLLPQLRSLAFAILTGLVLILMLRQVQDTPLALLKGCLIMVVYALITFLTDRRIYPGLRKIILR